MSVLSLVEWPEPVLELIGFLAVYLSAGAVGYRFSAARGAEASATAGERRLLDDILRRAAMVGALGGLLGAYRVALRLPGMAERRGTTVLELVSGTFPVTLQVGLLALVLLGFALAIGRVRAGWWLAACGVVGTALGPFLTGQWTRWANPVHELAGGLWLGTLAVLVLLGLGGVLRAGVPAERRGLLAALMVDAYSPLALAAFAVLGVSGVSTAWSHLKRVESLWTTPYGGTLVVKLGVVALVVALGVWNWRRQKPRLGTESAARALRGSAAAELALASVVLLVTSVLVSLPAPK
jgi:putative copper export protein